MQLFALTFKVLSFLCFIKNNLFFLTREKRKKKEEIKKGGGHKAKIQIAAMWEVNPYLEYYLTTPSSSKAECKKS